MVEHSFMGTVNICKLFVMLKQTANITSQESCKEFSRRCNDDRRGKRQDQQINVISEMMVYGTQTNKNNRFYLMMQTKKNAIRLTLAKERNAKRNVSK